MQPSFIVKEKVGTVLRIALNVPDTRNALSMELRSELLQALEDAERDEDVRVIILTGEGKAFSAGGDLKALKGMTTLKGRQRLQQSQPLIFKMLDIEKPIIASVNGPAAGAGFSLVLLCDYVIASEQAFFVQSFVHVGLVPDFAALHFLPTLIGKQKAKELMFLGERVTAQEAEQLGIVNRVVAHDSLQEKTYEVAKRLASKSPVSIGLTKKLLNSHMNRDLKTLLELEASAQDLCFQSDDFKEGVSAFFEKRQPEFKGM